MKLVERRHSIPPFFDALERGEVTAGMVVIFRYQGPKGAPGMPEVCTIIRQVESQLKEG